MSFLGVLICLVTIEYAVLGHFSWNYEQEFELIATQNATAAEIHAAKLHAKDVADMQLFSRVVVSFVAATFFMLIFVWRTNVKDLANKEKIELEWAKSRKEMTSVNRNISLITDILVYGQSQLSADERENTLQFFREFWAGNNRCGQIVNRHLTSNNRYGYAQMEPNARSVLASQDLRQIISEFQTVETAEVSIQSEISISPRKESQI